MALMLFAAICVRDCAAARPWYEPALGGEPTFVPNATEAVWDLAENRSVYIREDPKRAGRSVVSIFVDDLDAQVASIVAHGIEPTSRDTYSNDVRKTTYHDADGNEVGFGDMPDQEGSAK